MAQSNGPWTSFAGMDPVNLEAFKAKLRQTLQPEVRPGWEAQQLACPPGRPPDLPKRIESARRAGVVCLMWWDPERAWVVLFMRRTQDGTAHSGQWAFPGGAEEVEDGGDLGRTARRECMEEIGVQLADDDIVGALSPLYIPPSHFYVEPLVAVVDGSPTFVLERDEVEEVVAVPLGGLPAQGQTWPTHTVPIRGGNASVPGWPMHDGVLWGASAMMTAELQEVCAQAGFGRSFAASENPIA